MKIVLSEENEYRHVPWASIADIMSGLMVIFLFIAIAFMHEIDSTREKFFSVEEELRAKLHAEFKEDLEKWNAEWDKEDKLLLRFREPEVLFRQSKADINQKFKTILEDFFPRYISIIHPGESIETPWKEHLKEIRIEGHTSSEWITGLTPDNEAYKRNLELSQERARNVFFYCIDQVQQADYGQTSWLRKYLTANGLSSSRPILKNRKVASSDPVLIEDKDRSRRVEFRVVLSSDQVLKNWGKNVKEEQ